MMHLLSSHSKEISDLNKAWKVWTDAARSRVYLPYPSPELEDDTTAPAAMRRAWHRNRSRALSHLRRVLPPEHFQEAESVAASRAYEIVSEREPAAA